MANTDRDVRRRDLRAASIALLTVLAACSSDGGGGVVDTGQRERRPPGTDISDGSSELDVSDPLDCECPPGMHCGPSGACEEGPCQPATTSCADQTSLLVCSESGDSFDVVDCSDGWLCDLGRCAPPSCTPNASVGCDEGMLLVCDSTGTSVRSALCPAGEGCVDRECRPIVPNVLLLVDTSSSMNWTPDGTQPDECGSGCWPWSYPSCDNDPAGPSTRLGRVKEALIAILGSESAVGVQIALQRFPQRIYTALPPDCEGGYWTGNTTIQGDEEYHALSRIWLAQQLSQVVLAPFPEDGETDLAGLARWLDNEEQMVATSTPCSVNDQCDNTPCLDGQCMAFANPELWGMGLTPLGKSLFYSGEYMRHFVVVEGRACQMDSDCGSANYACVDGACHDPFRRCRPNVVIAFTDGEETEHFYTDDFFHPRVQAKRLHYGLGCEEDADCAADAFCDEGVCRPPAGVIDETQLVCDANDVPCTTNGDCGAFRCRPARLDMVDPTGEDVLRDAAGDTISLTIHVVDASNVPDANNLVAAYGGGQHFSVDLDDPEAIFETFETLFGDAKESFVLCLDE